jgi:hypothetical protein
MTEMPKAYDFSSKVKSEFTSGGRKRLVQARGPAGRRQTIRHLHPAAQRDRRAAHGARHVRRPGRFDDPPGADAGAGRPLGARHRPRRYRHPASGGKNACCAAKAVAPGNWARERFWNTHLGLEGKVWRPHHQPAAPPGASCDWDRERFTLDEGLSRAVRKRLCACTAWG